MQKQWQLLTHVAVLLLAFGSNSSFGCGKNACIKNRFEVKCSQTTLTTVPSPDDLDRYICNPDWDKYGPDTVQKLTLSDGKFSTLNRDVFRYFPNLAEIHADNCTFARLEANAFHLPEQEKNHLKVLSLRNNFIRSVDARAFAGLQKIEKLDLTGNRIASLPDEVFDDLVNLKTLYLDNNFLSQYNPRWFKNTVKLEKLSMSSNRMTELPFGVGATIKSVEEFNLRNNTIAEIPANAFKGMTRLRTLKLNDNKLTTLDERQFADNKELYMIYLENNGFESLPKNIFSDLCGLLTLDLSGNKLKTAHYQWYAAVVDNIDTVQGDYKLFPNAGNPWVCDQYMHDYKVFLSVIFNDRELKSVKLEKYLQIACSGKDRGIGLVTEDSFDRSLLTGEIFTHNENSTCLGTPMCPFLAKTCAYTQVPPTFPNPPPTPDDPRDMIKIIFVGIVLLAIILCLMCVVKHMRNRKQKDDSSDTSSESFYRRGRLSPIGADVESTPRSSFLSETDQDIDCSDTTSLTRPKQPFSPDDTVPKLPFSGPNTNPKSPRGVTTHIQNKYTFPEGTGCQNDVDEHGYTPMKDLLPPVSAQTPPPQRKHFISSSIEFNRHCTQPCINCQQVPMRRPNQPCPNSSAHQYAEEIRFARPPRDKRPLFRNEFPNNSNLVPAVIYLDPQMLTISRT